MASPVHGEQGERKSRLSDLLSRGHRGLRAAWTLIEGVPQHASQKGSDLPSLAYRVWDQGWLLLICGITPTNYYRYRLFRPGRTRDQKALFLGFFDGWRWLLAVNGKAPALLVNDKVLTARLLSSSNVPQPECLGVFGLPVGQLDPGANARMRMEMTRFLSAPDRQDFFLKPVYGRAGAGHISVGRCLRPGAAWELLPSREAITAEALIDRIAEAGTPYVAQRRLRPHQGLACFGPDVLHTIRFITVLDGEVKIAQAAMKIGIGDSSVDNMSKGNLVAGIELATGLTRTGHQYRSSGRLLLCRQVDTHPRTNCRIAGQQVPLWREAVETVKAAAAGFYLNTVTAWDVAVTDQGPVVIEGNSDPQWLLTQVANDEGLLATPLGELLYRSGHLDKLGVGFGLKAAYERAVLGMEEKRGPLPGLSQRRADRLDL